MRRSGTSVFSKNKISNNTSVAVTSLKDIGSVDLKVDKEKEQRLAIDKAKNNIPKHIIDVFSEDYDIINLDIIVQANIELETEKGITRLYKRIEAYTEPGNIDDNVKSEIKILEDRINQLKSNFPIKTYRAKTSELLDKYTNLPKVNIKINKDGKPINDEEKRKKKEFIDMRKLIIRKYISIAKDFMNIDIMEKVSTELSCEVCDTPYDTTGADPSGQLMCETCGTTTFTSFDFSSSSVPKSNNNSDWENFLKTLVHIQGKQKKEIPNDVYLALDKYFDNTIHHRDKVKHMKLDKMGHRGDTSVDLLVNALNMTGNSNYYSDVFKIGKEYWDWELYDLDPYMEIIMNRYELRQSIYYRLSKDRKSSLGTMFLAQQILNDIFGIGCEAGRDIKMHRMRSSIDFHDSCNKIMSDQSVLDFFETGCGDSDDIEYVMSLINGISISNDGNMVTNKTTSDDENSESINFDNTIHEGWDDVPFNALSTNKRNLNSNSKDEDTDIITEIRTTNGKIEVLKYERSRKKSEKCESDTCDIIEVEDILESPSRDRSKGRNSNNDNMEEPRIPFKEISNHIRNIGGGFIADAIDSMPNNILCALSNDVINILDELNY